MAYNPLVPVDNLDISSIPAAIRTMGADIKQLGDDHAGKTTGAHAASAISCIATGDIAATNVQAAIAELASEKVATTDTRLSDARPANGGNADTATTATKFATARSISGVPFDGTADIMLETNTPGLTNYVADGLKLTPSAGLTATVSAGRASISETVASLAAPIDITLDARRACLVYFSKNGNIGKVNASLPAVDTNTVALWDFSNWDGVSPIPNSAVGVNGNTIAVANNLTKSGMVTRVDGHVGYAAQGDGSTGYFVSANSTGFPLGASVREVFVLYTPLRLTGIQSIFVYGRNGNSSYFQMYTTGDKLGIGDGTNNYDTGFALEIGKTYLLSFLYNGTNGLAYVNGTLVYNGAIAVNTVNGVLHLLQFTDGTLRNQGTIHYIELRNKMRTPAQIATISNKLCLPANTNISETLLPDSISLGYIKTSSTAVVEVDANSYKYGRREGAVDGNRRVFLGWKYFSGATTLVWGNPFGTRKVKTYYTWAQDVNGTNESFVPSWFVSNTTDFGVRTLPSVSPSIAARIGDGGAIFWGGWQTTGYIGCYAEVID